MGYLALAQAAVEDGLEQPIARVPIDLRLTLHSHPGGFWPYRHARGLRTGWHHRTPLPVPFSSETQEYMCPSLILDG
jgi:hypothetical protein